MENKFLKLALVSATMGLFNAHVGHTRVLVDLGNLQKKAGQTDVFYGFGDKAFSELLDQKKKSVKETAVNDDTVNKATSDNEAVNDDTLGPVKVENLINKVPPANVANTSENKENAVNNPENSDENQNDLALLKPGEQVNQENNEKVEPEETFVPEKIVVNEPTWTARAWQYTKYLAAIAAAGASVYGIKELFAYLFRKPDYKDYNEAKEIIALEGGQFTKNQECFAAVQKLTDAEANQYGKMNLKGRILRNSENANLKEALAKCPVTVDVLKTREMAKNLQALGEIISNADGKGAKITEKQNKDLLEALKKAQAESAKNVEKNVKANDPKCKADANSEECKEVVVKAVNANAVALENDMKKMYADLKTAYNPIVEEKNNDANNQAPNDLNHSPNANETESAKTTKKGKMDKKNRKNEKEAPKDSDQPEVKLDESKVNNNGTISNPPAQEEKLEGNNQNNDNSKTDFKKNKEKDLVETPSQEN